MPSSDLFMTSSLPTPGRLSCSGACPSCLCVRPSEPPLCFSHIPEERHCTIPWFSDSITCARMPLHVERVSRPKYFLQMGRILFQNELLGMSAFHSLDSGSLPKKAELDCTETTSLPDVQPQQGWIWAPHPPSTFPLGICPIRFSRVISRHRPVSTVMGGHRTPTVCLALH